MGGANETKVAQKSPAKSAGNCPHCDMALDASPASVIGSVRVHESGGEVHFHDDKSENKVAMPVAVWYERYENLLAGSVDSVRYVDAVNKTLMTASLAIADPTDPAKRAGQKLVDLLIEISKIEISAEMSKIHKFTQGN